MDKQKISSMEPEEYAVRFLRAMVANITPLDSEKRKASIENLRI